MNVRLHRAITAGVVRYLCSATVLIVAGVPSGLFLIFLWARDYLLRARPFDIGWDAGVFLCVQLCAVALIVYGLVRQFVFRRVMPMTVVKDRAWPHLAVGALLAVAAIFVFVGFDVWTSMKLDLMGATAHGSSQWIRDYTVRYEFATEDGQIIAAIRSHVHGGNAFVYLRDTPHVFKVKGSGRGPQIGFVLFCGLAVWQFVAGVQVVRKTRPLNKTNETRASRALP